MGPAASPLTCLIYWSRPSADLLDRGIVPLVESSARRNAQDDITGVLLLNRGYVMQALEGPTPAVEACFQRIAADPRHRDVTLISLHAVGERSFQQWSMRLLPPLANGTPMLSQLFDALVETQAMSAAHDYALWLLRAHALRVG